VERIFAKEIYVEKGQFEEIEVKRVKIKDKITGEIYCLWIENGQLKKEKGECDEKLKTEESSINEGQTFGDLTTSMSTTTQQEQNEGQTFEPIIEQSNNENGQGNQ